MKSAREYSDFLISVSNLFYHLSPDRIVFIDTETTGIDSAAEVCQISIIDFDEQVLFYELIKPTQSISEKVTKIHGITDEMVADKHTISYWWRYLTGNKVLGGKIILGYNIFYDLRLLSQSMSKFDPYSYNLNIPALMVIDVMQLYSFINFDCKWKKLEEACSLENIELSSYDDHFHDAKYDTIMTCRLFKKVIGLL